ncbi:signal peptidase I [Povalibacter uvarum]|uniref:Signal peptidase I n=1 Tax=Povalibacter uvarum TaxID=732238 RepID=A0A841HVM4_9GAMM|nr:signal peptidase I [Povalibacter uvarum]MBB6096309.1 signal peptidase I [Povalibacter uvarum]
MTTASDSKPQARRTRRIIGLSIAWIGSIVFTALVIARLFIYEPFRTPSAAMYPTLPAGSIVLVDKRGFAHAIPFRLGKLSVTATPKRGDIIVFYLRDGETAYLKRIIGLPGDRIVANGTELLINSVKVPVTPGNRVGRYRHAVEILDGEEVSIAWLPERPSLDFVGTVPPGHYFTMGDNRDNSRDSRFPEVGYVPEEDIIGRVVKVVLAGRSRDPLE